MSRMISVQGSDDYKLLIEFEDGSKLAFNMRRLVKTIPYIRLKDTACFQAVKFDEKSVYWDADDQKPEYLPLRISIDSILFALRD